MNLSRYVPFFKTYHVTCKDGTERIIYKDIDHAFPLSVANWESNLSGKLRNDLAGDASIDAKFSKKIEVLLFALDEFNNNSVIEFRAAYLAFQTDPCGKAEYFSRSVERIADRRNQLIVLKTQISALIELAKGANQSAELTSIFAEIVRQLRPEQAVAITVAEMKEAASEAEALGDREQ